MKRQAVMFLVTLVACLAAAATAQAAPPIIERVPIDDQFRDEDSCAFPVQVHVTGFLVHIEWVAQDGDVRFVEASPQLKLTLTNLDTGGNHHGQRLWPLHVTQNADGGFTAVETGLWGRLENPKTGERGMFQSAGRRVISVDAEGNESDRFVGRVTDLCAELAA
jgi:hypothetical protein